MAVTSALNGKILAFDTTVATNLVNLPLLIRKIRWAGPSTAAHQCVVKNYAGTETYWSALAEANAAQETDFNPPLAAASLSVPTLGSGTLYVYLA